MHHCGQKNGGIQQLPPDCDIVFLPYNYLRQAKHYSMLLIINTPYCPPCIFKVLLIQIIGFSSIKINQAKVSVTRGMHSGRG